MFKHGYIPWNKGLHYKIKPHSVEYRQKMSRLRMGEGNPMYGKHLTDAHKKTISLAQIGRHHSVEAKIKLRNANLGNHLSIETKEKISQKLKGRISPNKGNKFSELSRFKISLRVRGAGNPKWKGGIIPLYEKIRKLDEYSLWRKLVFERDRFICQECFISGDGENLRAHHIKRFSEIITEFLQEYNQFSLMEDTIVLARIAINYQPFWNLNNGRTLCKTCHDKLHQPKEVSYV